MRAKSSRAPCCSKVCGIFTSIRAPTSSKRISAGCAPRSIRITHPNSYTPCAVRGIRFVRLPRVLRTTSFRLTLLYAGLFCASVLVLFGAMYWFGTAFITDQIDRTVASEIAEMRTAAHGTTLDDLQKTVADYSANAPG